MVRAIHETWQVARSEVAARWGGFCLLTLLTLGGYGAFVSSMVALNAGALPNYFKGFRVFEGIVETLTLSMPVRERIELLAEQPILLFGYRHPVMGSLEGAYTLTLLALLNFLVMSALIALYCLLAGRALRRRVSTKRTAAAVGVGGGGSVLGVLTAGAATVACCGGAGGSILLSLLGAGAGVGLFLAEHNRAVGALGIVLMIVNLWVAAGWVSAATCPGRGGREREEDSHGW